MTSPNRDQIPQEIDPDARQAARRAGLLYTAHFRGGIRRVRSGRGFVYESSSQSRVVAATTLARIRSLAIPPAWTNVWISPSPRAHIQATGRDARGRKQYRYHPSWRKLRDEAKYERLARFCRVLPVIRRRVLQDLSRRGLPREKVLATVVQLLATTFLRIGNDEYARANNSFGLTTLRDHHVAIAGAALTLRFPGKSGKENVAQTRDARVTASVRRCRAAPGRRLFQYLDERDRPRAITAAGVNRYLREISGHNFTAKDFRTWAGSRLAARVLLDLQPCSSAREARRNCARAVEAVARSLGNTRAVCRKSYVLPAVLEAYERGSMSRLAERLKRSGTAGPEALPRGLSRADRMLLLLLRSAAPDQERGPRRHTRPPVASTASKPPLAGTA